MAKKVCYRYLVDIVVNRMKKKHKDYVFKEEDAEIIKKLAFGSLHSGLQILQQVHGPNLDRASNLSIVGDYNNAIASLFTLFEKHIYGIEKPVKEEKVPVSYEQMMYNYVIDIIRRK